MEIKHCLRCDKDWCFRGTGRPVRCGRCKSPYWDRKRGGDGPAIGRPLTKEQVDSPTFGTPAPRPKVSPQVAGVGVLEGSSPVSGEPQGSDHDVSPGKSCRACEEPMKAVKGKWVCSEQTCSLLGQAQGDAR